MRRSFRIRQGKCRAYRRLVPKRLVAVWSAWRAAGQGPADPFWVAARPGSDDPQAPGAGRAWLDQARGQGQPGQAGAAAAAGLVPDPVQVRADGADADVQLGGDLRIGPPLGDQGDQLPLPGTELPGTDRGR